MNFSADALHNPLAVPIKEAKFPAPFSPGLEFNAPVHGTWNIVHVGMQIPEARQIYVCAKNCMRGVILTAAEMGESERFSFVILNEEDLLEGTVEDVTLEGTADVLHKLEKQGKLPPAVLLFTVCTHRFLGCNLNRIYRELERRFPQVEFVRCFMEPITQKEGLSPDTRLRKGMFDLLSPLPAEDALIAHLGSDFSLSETADLRKLLQAGGKRLIAPTDCRTYAEFKTLGAAGLVIATFPRAVYGAKLTAERLQRPFLYLPASFSYEEIDKLLRTAAHIFSLPAPNTVSLRTACEEHLLALKVLIGDTPIVIDSVVHPRPLGLARLLLTHGFAVKIVYADAFSGEEQQDFLFLQQHFPALLVAPTNQPACRVVSHRNAEKVLAIGPMAAWFQSTPYFVNMVEGGGLWGYDGILRLLDEIELAFKQEKDTEDLVPRKGLGCMSCL